MLNSSLYESIADILLSNSLSSIANKLGSDAYKKSKFALNRGYRKDHSEAVKACITARNAHEKAELDNKDSQLGEFHNKEKKVFEGLIAKHTQQSIN